MPLPKPTLDNRRYDQLVGEGRALIPRLAPAWTDQNASDPGITLIELGAWLSEQAIYRFDRVSDEALRAFVRLVGVEPRMPAVARDVVAIRNGNVGGLALPPRMQLADAAALPRFETTRALFASPCNLVSVMTGAATLTDASAANAALAPFDAFGARPRPDHALYLGVDQALDAAGATLALHVWTQDWQADAATQAALQAEHDARPPRQPRGRYRPTRRGGPRTPRAIASRPTGGCTIACARFGNSMPAPAGGSRFSMWRTRPAPFRSAVLCASPRRWATRRRRPARPSSSAAASCAAASSAHRGWSTSLSTRCRASTP